MERISQYILTIQHHNTDEVTDDDLRAELQYAIESDIIPDNEHLEIEHISLIGY